MPRGRKPKEKPIEVVIKENNPLNGSCRILLGDFLVCPECGKTFKVDETTKYITKGYVCSWECFLKKTKKGNG